MGTRVVCFDLGGVVVRICRSFEEAALAANLPLRRVPDDERSRATRRDLIERHQRGVLSSQAFHRELARALDAVYSPDELALAHAAVLLGEYPGITETIRSINGRGLHTACLSNTSDDHWRVLTEMPALRSLHARHASHLWGLAKPDPSIYRRFESEVRASGDAILFFDDLEENVAAAMRLGWDAVQIDHTGDTAAQVRAALAARGVSL
jgi:putative hydrolase of the HAD superfamily